MAIQAYAYTCEDGDIKRVRLDDDTAAAGGFTATTGFNDRDSAKVSKTSREAGLRPRGVRLKRTDGNAIRYRFLPCATSATVDSLVTSGTVTIGSQAWTVTTAVGENTR